MCNLKNMYGCLLLHTHVNLHCMLTCTPTYMSHVTCRSVLSLLQPTRYDNHILWQLQESDENWIVTCVWVSCNSQFYCRCSYTDPTCVCLVGRAEVSPPSHSAGVDFYMHICIWWWSFFWSPQAPMLWANVKMHGLITSNYLIKRGKNLDLSMCYKHLQALASVLRWANDWDYPSLTSLMLRCGTATIR